MNPLFILNATKTIQSEQGQGFVEYAMGLTFIFFIVVIVLALFGSAVGSLYHSAITELLHAFQGV